MSTCSSVRDRLSLSLRRKKPPLSTISTSDGRARFMELSSRKTSKRAIEPVDEWLQNEGYYRKHAPKDPTCLFRAVSEQVYQNQRCHIRVRKECIEYMKKNRQMFEEKISIPYDSYLDQMACFTEWGGMNEILAMSLFFKRNVIIFHGQKFTRETVIDHGFKDSLYLCFTPPKQYESVYTQEYTADAGFCQYLVYQTLYKNVFKMNNVDVTVHKMLHERSNNLRHDKFFLKGNLDIRNQLTLELLDKIDEVDENNEEMQLLSKGITPFPYRVAKALDPNIYRNIDYDIWHEIRREVRNSGYTKFNSTELQAGAKCLVQIDLKENDRANNNFLATRENWDNNSKTVAKTKRLEPLFYTGHIQEMSKNDGPVVVFIEEIGEKMSVSYDSLKPFPQKKMKQNNWAITANKRNMMTQNTKWKKPWNPPGRKIKEQISSDSNTDKNQMNSNTKAVTKNVMNKSEWSTETTLDNQSIKLQAESYTSYKDYNANASVENVRTVLENTHIPTVETVEQSVIDKKPKNAATITDANTYDNSPKKQTATNYNHDVNQTSKQHNQHNQHAEKNEIFYPTYPNTQYSSGPCYPRDSEMVNYEIAKSLDIEGSDIPYSDPATVRHFFNLGVKYFWSQNMWANGTNGQSFADNSYYMIQSPIDLNLNANMMNGTVSNGENTGPPNGITNGNSRHNSRSSPPRQRDQESLNTNSSRAGGQKSNYRNSAPRELHQSTNIDVSRNRLEGKSPNLNDQQQLQNSNAKEVQRVNKSNGVAPRFKKNYEGRNRNDHHNIQQQQYQQQYRHQQQHQQEYDYRGQNKKGGQSETQPLVVAGQCEMNEAGAQIQQQQPQNNHLQHQQQTSVLQPQTPPPQLGNSYAYPISYNQQVPYISLAPYSPESEAFPGHYYPSPPSFVSVPYLPAAADVNGAELSNGPCPMPPVYPATMDSFPAGAAAQYPPIYSQYVYHTPVYPGQPPAIPADAAAGYPPYPGQPYFFPYPPPPLTTAANPQSAPPAH